MRVAGLAFDFNGTLSDDEELLHAIYAALFAEHGRPLSRDAYFGELAGLSEEAIIGRWLGVADGPLAELVEERVDRYVAAADGSTIHAAVRAAVRAAARRVPVGVVSGARRREIVPVLEAAGLAETLSFLVAADDVREGKPHPESYLRAAQAVGIAPAALLALEDTEAGIASAVAAGCRCVAVLGTMPAERLAAAHSVVDRLDAQLVRRLLG